MLVFLRRRWRGHVRWIVLLAVMLLFASHPEVRLMVPLLMPSAWTCC